MGTDLILSGTSVALGGSGPHVLLRHVHRVTAAPTLPLTLQVGVTGLLRLRACAVSPRTPAQDPGRADLSRHRSEPDRGAGVGGVEGLGALGVAGDPDDQAVAEVEDLVHRRLRGSPVHAADP